MLDFLKCNDNNNDDNDNGTITGFNTSKRHKILKIMIIIIIIIIIRMTNGMCLQESSYQPDPADWRCNGVAWTSMRRTDVASTSMRRHFDVMCPLGNDLCINTI